MEREKRMENVPLVMLNVDDYKIPVEGKPTFQKTKSYIKNFKLENNYRKGNQFHCCLLCANILEKRDCGKTFLKCKNLGTSNSAKTDVGKTMVCDLFKFCLGV